MPKRSASMPRRPRHFKLDDTKLPLTEAQFRTSLSAANMVNAARVSAARNRPKLRACWPVAKRGWRTTAPGSTADARRTSPPHARKLDAAFAQLQTGK